MQAPIKCFLIDNDIEDQEIFILALEEVDPTILCECADDGLLAIQRFTQDKDFLPNVIFIDMNMPLLNGIQTLEKIRQFEHLQSVPIYMYSTAADPASVGKVKEQNATDFILKPSSFKGLIDVLSGILLKKNN